MSKEPMNQDMKHYFEQIELKREDVTTIITPPFLPAFADMLIEILNIHLIQVDSRADSCLIHFPVGTSKTELLPRVYNERYRIILPDGFELREVRRRGESYSYLQCDVATLTLEQQRGLKGLS